MILRSHCSFSKALTTTKSQRRGAPRGRLPAAPRNSDQSKARVPGDTSSTRKRKRKWVQNQPSGSLLPGWARGMPRAGSQRDLRAGGSASTAHSQRLRLSHDQWPGVCNHTAKEKGSFAFSSSVPDTASVVRDSRAST